MCESPPPSLVLFIHGYFAKNLYLYCKIIFANLYCKNILQIYLGYVFYMSHILTEVRIDQGSLSLRHLSKSSWSTFPIFRIHRDLYQSGDCLNRARLFFPNSGTAQETEILALDSVMIKLCSSVLEITICHLCFKSMC